MAFALDDIGTTSRGFVANISGDLSACETIKAAGGAGTNILLESLTIYTVDGETVTIGEGETTSAVTTEIAGPFDTGGTSFHMTFIRPVMLTANTALTVDSSGAGGNTVLAQGRIV